jgi:D-alanyl-lipoteichoic acid acyltransferase DltB (MBOAT superfamily)
MLFGSYEFLFALLPLTLVGYHLFRLHGRPGAARFVLVFASLFFYGWWDVSYVPLIVVSILVNFALGLVMGGSPGMRRPALIAGLVFNLGLLGYYKYANFFLANVGALTGVSYTIGAIILPIGISFFTFQQIVYLVDAARDGRCEQSIVNYSLFVLFFPHLIAGPITHPREMLPQFAAAGGKAFDFGQLNVGMSLLVLGLAKKAVVADTLGAVANPVFAAADAAGPISSAAAWMGALAYTFQLYFDFSGYSDMAIGLGLLFGIHLPVNFASPYKSKSIGEFWRRWHITLSRFLRNYIYIPLGGNRRGPARRYVNLMVTMGLGGLWHGAGWTFLAWGLLHGSYLVVDHVWSRVGRPLPAPLAWAVTFLAVVTGWVLFRATTFGGALTILAAMVTPGATVPSAGSLATPGLAWAGIGVAAAIALLLPNSLELVGYGQSMPNAESDHVTLRTLVWRPAPALAAVVLGLVAALVIAKLPDPGVFLYFNF